MTHRVNRSNDSLDPCVSARYFVRLAWFVVVLAPLPSFSAAQDTTNDAPPTIPPRVRSSADVPASLGDDHAANANAESGPTFDELLKRLRLALASDDPKPCIEALIELTDRGGDEAAAALAAAALSDADASVRVEAVLGLGEIGDEADLESLEDVLLDLDAGVRVAAIEAITDIGGDDSAWTLAIALTDEEASVREETVYALGEIGGEIAIRLLQQALADENSSIREAVTEALAELADEQ